MGIEPSGFRRGLKVSKEETGGPYWSAHEHRNKQVQMGRVEANGQSTMASETQWSVSQPEEGLGSSQIMRQIGP